MVDIYTYINRCSDVHQDTELGFISCQSYSRWVVVGVWGSYATTQGREG